MEHAMNIFIKTSNREKHETDARYCDVKAVCISINHLCKHSTPHPAVNPLQVEEDMYNRDKFAKIQLPVLVKDAKGGSTF
jgi:methionine aminopeptidase